MLNTVITNLLATTTSWSKSQITELENAKSFWKIFPMKIWYISWKVKFLLSWESIEMLKTSKNIWDNSIKSINNLTLKIWANLWDKNFRIVLIMPVMISSNTKSQLKTCLFRVKRLIRILTLYKVRSSPTVLKISRILMSQWMIRRKSSVNMKYKIKKSNY